MAQRLIQSADSERGPTVNEADLSNLAHGTIHGRSPAKDGQSKASLSSVQPAISPTIKFVLILLIGGGAAAIAHAQSNQTFSSEHAVWQYENDSPTW